jgi:hypothetical protein
MVRASDTVLGKGAYSVADAARIVGANYHTLRGWLNPDHGIVHRKFDSSTGVVSFAELMEMQFIKMFMDAGVQPRVIHAASRKAAKLFKTAYPFTVKRFDTDGKTIFATLASEDGGKEMIEDLRKGQLVFTTIVRPFFKKLDYDRNDIARYWPLGKRNRVLLDPTRQFGAPIDNETGVPTHTLYLATKAGQGQTAKYVANWYDVPESAVRTAVRFEKSLL